MPGLTREQANEFVSKIVPLYQPELETKPIGLPFEDVYDIEKVEPTAEWQGIYDEAKSDLISMGLPLDKFGRH